MKQIAIDEKSFANMDERTAEFYMAFLGLAEERPAEVSRECCDELIAIEVVREKDKLRLDVTDEDIDDWEDAEKVFSQEMTYEEYRDRMDYIRSVLWREENQLWEELPVAEYKEVFMDRLWDEDGPISHAFGSVDFQRMYPRPRWDRCKAEKKALLTELANAVFAYKSSSEPVWGGQWTKSRIRGICLRIRALKGRQREMRALYREIREMTKTRLRETCLEIQRLHGMVTAGASQNGRAPQDNKGMKEVDRMSENKTENKKQIKVKTPGGEYVVDYWETVLEKGRIFCIRKPTGDTLKVGVWTGQKGAFMTMNRSYRKDGSWVDTPFYGPGDMGIMKYLIEKAEKHASELAKPGKKLEVITAGRGAAAASSC